MNNEIKYNIKEDENIINHKTIYDKCIKYIASYYLENGEYNYSLIPKDVIKIVVNEYKKVGQLDAKADEVQFFINTVNQKVEELKEEKQKRTI